MFQSTQFYICVTMNLLVFLQYITINKNFIVEQKSVHLNIGVFKAGQQ